MQDQPKGSPSWQYLLWAGLLTAPVWGSVLALGLTSGGPSEPPRNEKFTSKGSLGNGLGEPYLKKHDGRSYRLLCPPVAGDRQRRECFEEYWWKRATTEVVVIHRKPQKRIVEEVVVCNITDLAGNTLLLPKWVDHCQ